MITHSEVIEQLKILGLAFRFFGKAETKELANIMNEGERILHCCFGYYQGGSALLVATNTRMLLIDKRPFFLNLEDIRYEMINEVDFAGRLLDATVSLHTGNKRLAFRSFADKRLRNMCHFVQDQITRARQLEHMVEHLKPAASEWRPYSLLLAKPRIQKFPSSVR
jgi:hypothetical protein